MELIVRKVRRALNEYLVATRNHLGCYVDGLTQTHVEHNLNNVREPYSITCSSAVAEVAASSDVHC